MTQWLQDVLPGRASCALLEGHNLPKGRLGGKRTEEGKCRVAQQLLWLLLLEVVVQTEVGLPVVTAVISNRGEAVITVSTTGAVGVAVVMGTGVGKGSVERLTPGEQDALQGCPEKGLVRGPQGSLGTYKNLCKLTDLRLHVSDLKENHKSAIHV